VTESRTLSSTAKETDSLFRSELVCWL